MKIEPNVTLTAFCCPHCGAYTTQYWYKSFVQPLDDTDSKIPHIPDEEFINAVRSSKELKEDTRNAFLTWAQSMRAKLLFPENKGDSSWVVLLNNLFLSNCYNCQKWSVWVNEDLIYPFKKFGSLPNQDLPNDILAVVEEARAILDLSPKGAAALLRLSIQMLCKHLGESGTNLNHHRL